MGKKSPSSASSRKGSWKHPRIKALGRLAAEEKNRMAGEEDSAANHTTSRKQENG
jgi:hypothetical protein